MTNVGSLLRQSGTLRYQAAGPPDERNDPTDTWTEVTVACTIQMRNRQEIEESGELSTTTWLAFFPATITPPVAADELVVDGQTYQFRGDSWLAAGSRGNTDHIEATLTRAV